MHCLMKSLYYFRDATIECKEAFGIAFVVVLLEFGFSRRTVSSFSMIPRLPSPFSFSFVCSRHRHNSSKWSFHFSSLRWCSLMYTSGSPFAMKKKKNFFQKREIFGNLGDVSFSLIWGCGVKWVSFHLTLGGCFVGSLGGWIIGCGKFARWWVGFLSFALVDRFARTKRRKVSIWHWLSFLEIFVGLVHVKFFLNRLV